MATADTGSIIRVPGRLSWNGTELGTCRGIRFRPNPRYREVWAEEFGTVVDEIYVGEGPCAVTAIVRYPDNDMISAAAPKSVAAATIRRWLFRPGGTTENTRAGTSMYASAGTLIFTPKAAAAHPAVKLYKAMPLLADDAELRFALGEEYGLAVRFVGTLDSNNRVYENGRLSELP